MDNLKDSGLLNHELTVLWHAGEPLSVPIDFYREAFPLVRSFEGPGLSVKNSIQTNGTLITRQHCDLFKSERVQVGVSLDGPGWIHDRHRVTRAGHGTFDSVMRGIGLLKESGIDFSTISVLTADSLPYPDEMYDFFVGQGIFNVAFNVEEIEGVHEHSSVSIATHEAQYREFWKRFVERVRRDGLLRLREYVHFEEMVYHGVSLSCGSQNVPLRYVCVDWNGDFSTFSPELLSMRSSTYGSFVLGNVQTGRIIDALTTDSFKQIYSDIQLGVEQCKAKCSYYSICGGGAPSNKIHENGTFVSDETMFCRLTKQVVGEVVLAQLEWEASRCRVLGEDAAVLSATGAK